MKQLLTLWEGYWKTKIISGEITKSTEEYVISKDDWILINTKLIPAQLAPYVKSVTKRSFWNANTYAWFLMHLGPIVLKDRLADKYYRHFVRLSDLTKQATQMEIKRSAVDALERGFVAWVEEFELLYYGFKPKNLPVFTAPIHALLHIAQYIRKQGPLCHHWCFYIERYGAWVKRQALPNARSRPCAIA
ncbi:hypothetical protein NCC49_004369 [Naganishia albida]|nr:hypothetical protein NCC49_004369 [Naganishia albida]